MECGPYIYFLQYQALWDKHCKVPSHSGLVLVLSFDCINKECSWYVCRLYPAVKVTLMVHKTCKLVSLANDMAKACADGSSPYVQGMHGKIEILQLRSLWLVIVLVFHYKSVWNDSWLCLLFALKTKNCLYKLYCFCNLSLSIASKITEGANIYMSCDRCIRQCL